MHFFYLENEIELISMNDTNQLISNEIYYSKKDNICYTVYSKLVNLYIKNNRNGSVLFGVENE